MKKQALATTDIETLELSTSAGFDERRQPLSEDSRAYLSKSKTHRRATLGWIIDSLAVASCAMGGVYVGVWLDPPDSDPNSLDAERQNDCAIPCSAAADHPGANG